MTKTKKVGFEEKLRELEKIAEKLNDPDCPLETSLELFEKGVNLSRQLHQELSEAKLKIKKLLGEGEAEELKDEFFDTIPPAKNGS